MPSVCCPRCAKKFKDQSTLLKHMNQLVSCLTHFQETINIANTLQRRTTPQGPASDDGRSQSLYFMDTTEDAPSADPVHSTEAPPLRNTGTQTTQNPFRIKKHPIAGITFSCGSTFMDHFDNDGFASARSQGYLFSFILVHLRCTPSPQELLDGQSLTHSLDHMITVDDHVTSHILYSWAFFAFCPFLSCLSFYWHWGNVPCTLDHIDRLWALPN